MYKTKKVDTTHNVSSYRNKNIQRCSQDAICEAIRLHFNAITGSGNVSNVR